MTTLAPVAPIVAERCDRCNATAIAKAGLAAAYLHFCQHHLNKQRDALELKGWTVTNLNERTDT